MPDDDDTTIPTPTTGVTRQVVATDSTRPSVALISIHSHNWPSGLLLDRTKDNWTAWLQIFNNVLGMSGGLYRYPEGLTVKPDRRIEPRAANNWEDNDRAVLSFIRLHIATSEREYVAKCATSKEAFDTLRDRHEKQGPLKQVLIMHEALNVSYSRSEDFSITTTRLQDLNQRIWSTGPPDPQSFLTILMLNALAREFSDIRSQVAMQLSQGTCTPDSIRNRLDTESSLHTAAASPPVVLVSQSAPSRHSSRLLCANPNCKSPTHEMPYCVKPGGGMQGKSIDEAKAAQRAAKGKTARPASATSMQTFSGPNGQAYALIDCTIYPVSAPHTPRSSAPSSPHPTSATLSSSFAGLSTDLPESLLSPGDSFEHAAWAAIGDDPIASVDWTTCSAPFDFANLTVAPVEHNGRLPMSLDSHPFWLDTGATSSISFERSDFSTLHPIPPHPIRGVGGSSILAVGMGTVILVIGRGLKLQLDNVLYIPNATVRLISVSAMNAQHHFTTSFGEDRCWITNRSGATICSGTLSQSRRLYTLSLTRISTHHSAFFVKARPPTLETWHARLGHANYRTVYDMARSSVVEGMPIDLSLEPPKCESCILGKQVHNSVPKVREGMKATRRLERVYVDLTGPMPVASRTGNRYLMNLIDDFSSHPWTFALKSKSDAFAKLQDWEKEMGNRFGLQVGIYVTDNGELKSKAMAAWCSEHGITHHLTAPYTSAQNGRAERLHLTIMNKGRAMRIACNAPEYLWDEFAITASYLSTLTPSISLRGHTPFEVWHNRRPNLSHLREIGCKAFVLHETHNPKIRPRSYECVLIGYENNSKAYRCWHRPTGKIVISFNVSFVEKKDAVSRPLHPGRILGGESSSSSSSEPALPNMSQTPVDDDDSDDSIDPVPKPDIPSASNLPIISNPIPDSPPSGPRRSSRNHTSVTRDDTNDGLLDPRLRAAVEQSTQAGQRLKAARAASRVVDPADLTQAMQRLSLRDAPAPGDSDDEAEVEDSLILDDLLAALEDPTCGDPVDVEFPDDPKNWKEAMAGDERDAWTAGAVEELAGLQEMGVYRLVPRSAVPHGRRILKGRFVCHRKRNEVGEVVRHKVRFVCKGFEQVYGQDYTKTTAPTARLESFRALLHLAAAHDWDAQQIDVKTAFLYGLLPEDEVQYMEQPGSFQEPGKEDWVWELLRGLYGMKQSGRIWNKTMHEAMVEWGFQRLSCEWCVYYRKTPAGVVLVAVHVDDMLSVASSREENERFKQQLQSKWKISDLGDIHFALGIAVERDRATHTVFLSQTALIDRIISQFRQKDSHPVSTPMDSAVKLRRPDPRTPLPADQAQYLTSVPYQSLVGSLMYLAIGTRPDIAYAVNRLAGFLNCYRAEHWHAACRVVRYLKGTRGLRLALGGRAALQLVGFTDSDYANCLDTRRSISGHCFSLGSGMISWSSRRQRTVADSTCYAEYIAAHSASRECMWLRSFLAGIDHTPHAPTPLMIDNNAAMKLAEDQQFHSEAKHIEIKYHVLRDYVADGHIVLQHVRSAENTADILTKALAPITFIRLRGLLGLQ